jgi:flagellar biogenesis protein FliO
MSCRAFLTAAFLGFFLWQFPGLTPQLLPIAAAQADESTVGDAGLIPRRRADPGTQKEGQGGTRTGQRSRPAGDGWWSTLGGLVAVLALVFLTAKVIRKSVPAAQKTLPAEVVQILGRKALDYRHTIHLVRFGSRMLMLGTSQEGTRTLSEISDPVEIDYLAGLCKPSDPGSVATTFSQLFQRFQNPEPVRDHTDSDAVPQREEEAQTEIEPDSDPAILRLQRRLQQTARGERDENDLPTTEAAG